MGRRTIDSTKLKRRMWLCLTDDLWNRIAAFAERRKIPRARALRLLIASGLRDHES